MKETSDEFIKLAQKFEMQLEDHYREIFKEEPNDREIWLIKRMAELRCAVHAMALQASKPAVRN